MPTEQKSPGKEIYQIKVTLLRTAPPIWRRLLVPADLTLAGLHDLLQLTMGWTNSHMHEFQFRGQCYGPTHPNGGVADAIDERKARLNQLLVRVGAKIVYASAYGTLCRIRASSSKMTARRLMVKLPLKCLEPDIFPQALGAFRSICRMYKNSPTTEIKMNTMASPKPLRR